jgi:two-component system, OmpR family, alkaline phosphatase synthesis response regulator PhoP
LLAKQGSGIFITSPQLCGIVPQKRGWSGIVAYRILVVDDDKNLVRSVRLYLEQADLKTYGSYDGEDAMRLIRSERPDLAVLDLMLPKRDGWDITQRVRSDPNLSGMGILMLTARVEDIDKLTGFDLGADDYLTKPFNPLEVVARVRAILRRATGKLTTSHILEVDGLRLDTDSRTVNIYGRPADLTPAEYTLLKTLMQNVNHVFTRSELIELAFGYSYESLERTLDTHIKNLRKKIEHNPAEPRYIETVYGVGYRLREERKNQA